MERLSTQTISRIRRLNMAFGSTPADDTVAERFFRDPTDTAPLSTETRWRAGSDLLAKRGWTEDGLVPAD